MAVGGIEFAGRRIIQLYAAAKNTPAFLGHDVIDCFWTGFARFNDDSGPSSVHLDFDRSHGDGLEDRHPAIADRTGGGSEERSRL